MNWLNSRLRGWPTAFGYALFIGMMAVGYYYNVTFVQLGLPDLGARLIGMDERQVAASMALMAVLTSLVALGNGWLMQRRGWSDQFITKLRLAFGVVLCQTFLTAVATRIDSAALFVIWVVATSVALGVGVPATFGLTVDLIRVRHRGYVAAVITGLAYFAANIVPSNWHIEDFRFQLMWLMFAATPLIGILTFWEFPFIDTLAEQHLRPEFAHGRFVRYTPAGQPRISRTLLGFIVIMFGIYFIDSLGFLRIIATPVYVDVAWRSPELAPRLVLGLAHVIAAAIAGILYTNLDIRGLFQWVFGIFALTHLMYTFPFQFPGAGDANTLAPALLYAIAVSLYTVLNFAMWADASTPRSISLNAAFGVALSAWTATFLSTALAIQWRLGNVPVDTHLRIVAATSTLFFLALLLASYLRGGPREANYPSTEGNQL